MHVSCDCPPHNTFCSVVVLFRCYTHVYISVYAYRNNSGSVPYEQQVPITLTVIYACSLMSPLLIGCIKPATLPSNAPLLNPGDIWGLE